MELIKTNKEKHRRVFLMDDRYRKYWYAPRPFWIRDHVTLLNRFVPGYVLGYGKNYIDFRIIEGTRADTVIHTDDFCRKIYKFCLDNIENTKPYAHGDWVLSNMIIKDDQIYLCDWDNLGLYPPEEIYKKLESDLQSAFGSRFEKIKNDSTII